mmetsp:Transcript_39551/g.114142  ORF Transcript_39551/g.114142 Transcript_39551/m.114142 type:complete len:216 (-) Transcript_39551:156-803(-)
MAPAQAVPLTSAVASPAEMALQSMDALVLLRLLPATAPLAAQLILPGARPPGAPLPAAPLLPAPSRGFPPMAALVGLVTMPVAPLPYLLAAPPPTASPPQTAPPQAVLPQASLQHQPAGPRMARPLTALPLLCSRRTLPLAALLPDARALGPPLPTAPPVPLQLLRPPAPWAAQPSLPTARPQGVPIPVVPLPHALWEGRLPTAALAPPLRPSAP